MNDDDKISIGSILRGFLYHFDEYPWRTDGRSIRKENPAISDWDFCRKFYSVNILAGT